MQEWVPRFPRCKLVNIDCGCLVVHLENLADGVNDEGSCSCFRIVSFSDQTEERMAKDG